MEAKDHLYDQLGRIQASLQGAENDLKMRRAQLKELWAADEDNSIALIPLS